MKNATQLSQVISGGAFKPSEINEALVALGLMRKVESGFETDSTLGVQKEFQEKKYVVWEEGIIEVLERHFNTPTTTTEDSFEAEFLTATQIGVEVGLSAKEVNILLVESGFMNKNENGFYSTHPLAEQCLTKEGKAYVKWETSIVKDAVFSREVKSSVETKEAFKEEVVAPSSEAWKFDRKTFDAKFRTQSGHFVRSRAEVIVADWLYANDVMFAYEKRLPIVEEVYSDFFIKEKRIFIEVWGLEDTKYLERKAVKIDLYAKNGFNLIGLSDKDIENIDDFLPLKLAQMGIVL